MKRKVHRCVLCRHNWWSSLGEEVKMKAPNCALGHNPRFCMEDPKDPRWWEYRSTCKDFKAIKKGTEK